MPTFTIEGCDAETMEAFERLSPLERGHVIAQWYSNQYPCHRYKRERQSLDTFARLLDETATWIDQYGFWRGRTQTKEAGPSGFERLARLASIESQLTLAQTHDVRYASLKARLTELQARAKVEKERFVAGSTARRLPPH